MLETIYLISYYWHNSKIIQYGGFLGSLLSKLASPLMKIAVPLAKTFLAPLEITAVASTTDVGIQKKIRDQEKLL